MADVDILAPDLSEEKEIDVEALERRLRAYPLTGEAVTVVMRRLVLQETYKEIGKALGFSAAKAHALFKEAQSVIENGRSSE